MKVPRFTGLDGRRILPAQRRLRRPRHHTPGAPRGPATPLELDQSRISVKIGDAIVVLGNSGGGGVVTKLEGKLVGIGPDRIEVSAEFIPGNSGSPIIHVPTGKVIGIATYLTRRYEEFAGNAQTPPAQAAPAPRRLPRARGWGRVRRRPPRNPRREVARRGRSWCAVLPIVSIPSRAGSR